MPRLVFVVLLCAACSSGGRDFGGPDLARGGSFDGDGGGDGDGGARSDGSPASDGATDFSGADLSGADFAGADFSGADFSVPDFSSADAFSADFSNGDFSSADFSPSDFAKPPSDLAPPASDLSPSRPPCLNGPGFAAFRFHYAQSSGTQAILDAFGLPDSSNWQAVPVYPTSYTDTNFGGGIELASGNWILIRYSVVGLTQISGATFSVYGRSYDVSASGSFDAWSPLYGDDFAPTDSMSVYPYAWRSIDFTGFVQVGDDPGLTGIRLYPGPSSDDLIVRTVELCIDGR